MINITIGKDFTKDMMESLKELQKKSVCIGIPQAENTVNGKGSITNAELLYIHTNGIRRRSMINEMNQSMGTNANGIPDNPNYDEFTDNMSNGMPYSAAYQLYVSSHGSPLWHSPPRPVIEPAIMDDKEIIVDLLKEAFTARLDGDKALSDQKLKAAGLEGQAAAQGWFTSSKNGWDKNSPITVKMKKSDMPLIDKGTMLKAITYVIRDDNND